MERAELLLTEDGKTYLLVGAKSRETACEQNISWLGVLLF